MATVNEGLRDWRPLPKKQKLNQEGYTEQVEDSVKSGVSLILRKCRNGDLTCVKQLVDSGCSILETDSEYHTAVHYAASGGHEAVAEYLFNKGLYLDSKSKRQQTPLHLACLNGHVPVARYLIRQKAGVDAEDKDGNTPLHLSVARLQLINYMELFLLLVNHGADVNAQNKDGQTALHIAAEENLAEAVGYLIQLGARVDIMDNSGVCALIAAADKASVETIQKLLEANADVDCKDNYGQTALHAACNKGHFAVLKILVENNANQAAQDKNGNIPLQKACQHGHLILVRYLIEKGSDIHSLDRNGQTPLHKACKGRDSSERCELIRYLISHGADINLQSQYARCPLHCTCEEGTPNVAQILLENHATVDLKDKGGRTPLHYAAFGGFSRFPQYNNLISILLQYQGSPNEKDKEGLTPLHLAAKVGNAGALSTFLRYNGDANTKCKTGKTAVHYTVIGDPRKVEPSVEVLTMLLNSGGDVNSQDHNGYTPLHYAAQGGNMDAVNLLLNHNADLMITSNDQKKPEDLSVHARVKNILLSSKQRQIHSKEGTVPLPLVKLFLTGHIKAGKTALRKHLGETKCNPSPSLHVRTKEAKERTAGIEIEYLKHSSFGTIVAHDLAGHCEYSTCHSVAIDCADSSLFIIVFDISKEIEEINDEVNYWAAFIKAGRGRRTKPRVMLLATHMDMAIAEGRDMFQLSMIYDCILNEWKGRYKKFFHVVEGEFIVNCLEADSPEMKHLRDEIGQCCNAIRETHEEIPTVCFELHNLLRNIAYDLNKPALRREDAEREVLQRSVKFTQKEKDCEGTIVGLFKYLSVMGMILFLESGWVVIQKEALLEHIFGVVFAPDGFFLRGLSDIKHGMVPLQRIHALFGKHYEVRLVIDILCELMLAKEIEEENALQIPALLKVKEQEEVWRVYWKQEPSKYSIHAGWRLECVDETDIFSPSFFPRLQVCMRKAKSSQVTAWANGLVFMEDRMQVMVYIEGRKTIDIIIRSEAGMERQCYNLRNEVQKQVKNELEECSSGTAYTNKLIRPADIRVCKPMNDMIAYDYEHVLCEKERGQSTISTDGIHCDTIRELLYCNYDPPLITDGDSAGLSLQDLPTDQELAAIAPLLIENWYEIGSRLGIDKTALDRIEQELEFMKGSDRAAIEMLYRAKEKPCFTTRAELVKKLDCLGARSAAQHLMCGL